MSSVFRRFPLALVVLMAAIPLRADEQSVRAQLQASREAYKTPIDWSGRRHELREEFLKGARLWPLPDREAPRVIRRNRREYDGYAVENLAIETLPGFFCAGNLYVPLGRTTAGPAILCPHGHYRPLGRYRDDQQIRCAHFARMGATVFSYSMVGWQDSQQTTHDDPLVLALQTWNSLRAVDYLASLDSVDADRIGVTGSSGGGTQTMFLTLIDDRIQVSAPVVIVYHWAAPEGCLCEGGLPVMQAAKTNAIELAAAIAPRPQLLISVGNDPTEKFPEFGFPFIEEIYRVCGAADRVHNIHYADEKHDFGPSKRRDVYEFFAHHLSMSVIDEDQSKITLERPEAMEVFSERSPLPPGSIRGPAAVAKTFERHLAELRKRQPDTRPRLAEYSFQTGTPADEALVFTPPGFKNVGQPAVARGTTVGDLQLEVVGPDGRPTFCRVNVVGPDGNFYEPDESPLKIHSLTGKWPNWPKAWGNRETKAPIRYFGRFFYCDGTATVTVPAGTTRIEVWKGFEYRPEVVSTEIRRGSTTRVHIALEQTIEMPKLGYWSGDPHVHIPRANAADESLILDLLQAEDVHYATILAYNEPAGPYFGFMDRMDSPQRRGLGKESLLSRSTYRIVSGQEYRSGTYGHLNLFMLDELVQKGAELNADNWPPYGHIGEATRKLGGYSFYAHGGYAQEIYADMVQGNVDGVELLQFGVYRGIGLIDWYRMLNAGFRFPATGASDYPACRKLADCRTYVHIDRRANEPPTMDEWLRGAADGRSFMTTGPLLFLEVDGHRPGARIASTGEHYKATVKLRVRSEVAPVTNVQLIVNGRIAHETKVAASAGQGRWIELDRELLLSDSSWIAARAFSLSRLGTPDAEAHTNPVYVYLNGRAPYDRDSLDGLVAAIDKQIAIHKGRDFEERAKIITYFERSRDILMRIREAGGAPAKGHPSQLADADPHIIDPGRRHHTDEELKAFLKPQPPRPIAEVMRSFDATPGFEMQLVAREPLVHDPIAAAFDENGHLYVCEMRDYPYKPREGERPIGSVRLLRDVDGDGIFDEAHRFAENLLWAGGIVPWKGGVFVAACPDIWYLKDTDGDFRADVRRKVYTGFGTGNQQAMVNNLKWGLDHKIYGSTAGNGGTIRHVDDENQNAIVVSGHDFRFDPVSEAFEVITGTIQFGNSFNDWGDRFLCSESRPLLHAVLPERYLTRNPFVPVPRAIQDVAQGPVPIFRISPLERWRMIRSSRRIAHGQRSPDSAGASHHVLDAAAGVTVYRGGAYPPEYYGDIFIGGAQNNVIHRRKLVADGVTYASQRVEDGTEFVRSSDNWFRPVNFVNAPDGTLYVLDMSREILETIHVPLDVTKFLDFKSGRDRGRIYRIAPQGFTYPGTPRLGRASTDELVAALESPHGWWRDTAHRLIFERQDLSASKRLREIAAHSDRAASRVQALWSLHGLNQLRDADVIRALDDPHARVRQHALRLSEARLNESRKLREQVLALIEDSDPHVRSQLAFTLGELDDPIAGAALARLATLSGDDVWLRTAVLSSANQLAAHMLPVLLRNTSFRSTTAGVRVIDQLAAIVGARGRERELVFALSAIREHVTNANAARRLVIAIGSGLKRSGNRLRIMDAMPPNVAEWLSDLIGTGYAIARRSSDNPSARVAAIRLVGVTPFGDSHATLERLARPSELPAVQLEAIRQLTDYPDARVADDLLRHWRTQTPEIRKAVVDALLSREDWTLKFLRAAAGGRATVAHVADSRRSLLVKHGNSDIRRLARQLLTGANDAPRQELIGLYKKALDSEPDLDGGKVVFRRDCQACHKVGSLGHAIGPDLSSSATRDPEALLVHILDPNRYVLPTFEQYVLVDQQGRTFTGMIASQTATGVTLKREEGKSDTVLRSSIEELASTGKSLMPEGFEKKISPVEMSNLIGYLRTLKPSGREPLHIGTLPGLIEPD